MPFDTTLQGITALQQQMRQSCQSEKDFLYLPLLGKRFSSSEAATEDLAASMNEFISDTNPKRVCTLFGDGGSGKSSFLKQFALKLLNKYESGKPIPLFVSLPLLTDPIHSVIEETLLKTGFNEAQIVELKTNHSFIFILDGYDEIHQLQNLYVSNRLSEWNAKTIISCRSQYLYNKENANLYFMPLENEREQPQLLQTLYVAPFDQDQIRQYLESYSNSNIAVSRYEEIITIPGLQDLITTPFLLKLAVEALPEILARYAVSSSTPQERQQLTQTDLYKSFIRRWFERQEQKLKDSGHISEDMLDQKPIFWRYCQSLALEMHRHNLSWLNAEDERFAVYFENDAETEMLRSACPIKMTEDKIGFWHGSLGMHFVAQTIYQEALAEENTHTQQQNEIIEDIVQERPQGDMHLRLETDNPTFLYNLADEVNKDHRYKAWLFNIIERSKTNKHYAVGAANAISVLNAAKISFSLRNFNNISISNANLTYAVLDHTQLVNADVSGADLSNSWLSNANFNNANLKDVCFNERPYLQFNEKVRDCCFSPNGLWLAITAGNGIFIFDVATYCQVDTYFFDKYIKIGHDSLFQDVEEMEENLHIIDMQAINSLCFSSDNQYIVSGGADPTVRLWRILPEKWNANDGKNKSIIKKHFGTEVGEKFVRAFQGNTKSINKVIFCNDGQRIASAGNDGSIFVWNINTADVIYVITKKNFTNALGYDHDRLSINELSGPVSDIAINSQGDNLISVNMREITKAKVVGTRFAYFWELQGAKLIYKFSIAMNSYITAAIYCNNDKYIVLGNDGGIIYIFLVETKENVYYGRLSSAITGIFYNSGGQELFIGSSDNTITTFNLELKKNSHQFQAAINFKKFSYLPKKKLIACGAIDNTVRFFDNDKRGVTPEKASINNIINGLLFLFSCQAVVSIHQPIQENDARIYKWKFSARSLSIPSCFEMDNNFDESSIVPTTVASSADEKLIATNTLFGACIWSVQTLKLICRISCWDLDQDNNERYAIFSHYQRSEKEPRTGGVALFSRLYPDSYSGFETMTFDNSSKYLITGGIRNIIHVWDFQKKALLCKFEGHSERISCIVTHPIESMFLSSDKAGVVRAWSLSMRELLWYFSIDSSQILALSLNASGTVIVVGHESGRIYFISFQSHAVLNQFSLEGNFAVSFSFNKTEELLAIGTFKTLVVLWDMANSCVLKKQVVATKSISYVYVSWAKENNQEFLITGGEDKAIRVWMLIREGEKIDLILLSTTFQRSLVAENATTHGALLDSHNELLLAQCGAITTIKKEVVISVEATDSDESSLDESDSDNSYITHQENSNSCCGAICSCLCSIVNNVFNCCGFFQGKRMSNNSRSLEDTDSIYQPLIMDR